MLEVKNLTLTHEAPAKAKKELLYGTYSSPADITDFTFCMGSFMLSRPEPLKKPLFSEYKLGEIIGDLSRKNIYEDR